VSVVLSEFEFENNSFTFEYRSGTTRIFYQISFSESYPGRKAPRLFASVMHFLFATLLSHTKCVLVYVFVAVSVWKFVQQLLFIVMFFSCEGFTECLSSFISI